MIQAMIIETMFIRGNKGTVATFEIQFLLMKAHFVLIYLGLIKGIKVLADITTEVFYIPMHCILMSLQCPIAVCQVCALIACFRSSRFCWLFLLLDVEMNFFYVPAQTAAVRRHKFALVALQVLQIIVNGLHVLLQQILFIKPLPAPLTLTLELSCWIVNRLDVLQQCVLVGRSVLATVTLEVFDFVVDSLDVLL